MITIYYENDKYKLRKNYPNDSAYDLCAKSPDGTITIPPGKRIKIPTGIKIILPPYWEANIRPRSGISLRYGITVLNTPGTIDQRYLGDISVILINHGEENFILKDGDRIAQITFLKTPKYSLEQLLVEQIEIKTQDNHNSRGNKGFVSSGTKNLSSNKYSSYGKE